MRKWSQLLTNVQGWVSQWEGLEGGQPGREQGQSLVETLARLARDTLRDTFLSTTPNSKHKEGVRMVGKKEACVSAAMVECPGVQTVPPPQ